MTSNSTREPSVAIVHDYLTQMGGAERVVLAMLRAFPDAPLYTSVYQPSATFAEFRSRDVRPMKWLNRVPLLRRHHWLGFPFYGSAFRRLTVRADVVICSSSGWAHHAKTNGHKIVYCHTPNRWIHRWEDTYRYGHNGLRMLILPIAKRLARRDRVAAMTAPTYLTNSSVVRDRISAIYQKRAEIVPPPPARMYPGTEHPCDVDPGYVLVVGRLLSYKNVHAVIDAVKLSGHRLIIVGDGPERRRLETYARETEGKVLFAGKVSDGELTWLHEHALCFVAASYEDFGLGPIEANTFGTPVAVLRWGGFLDTVIEGENGVFFDEPTADQIAAALKELESTLWDTEKIKAHAELFSEAEFAERLRATVKSVASCQEPAYWQAAPERVEVSRKSTPPDSVQERPHRRQLSGELL